MDPSPVPSQGIPGPLARQSAPLPRLSAQHLPKSQPALPQLGEKTKGTETFSLEEVNTGAGREAQFPFSLGRHWQ